MRGVKITKRHAGGGCCLENVNGVIEKELGRLICIAQSDT